MTAEQEALKVIEHLEHSTRIYITDKLLDHAFIGPDNWPDARSFWHEVQGVVLNALNLAEADIDDQIRELDHREDVELRFSMERGMS